MKDQEAINWLEKRYKATTGGLDSLSYEETVQMAISALQHVLAEDLKATDIEVGVASAAEKEGGAFRVLKDSETEEHLVAISERD